MPFEEIGIGIRARIQGTEEGERLAQAFQKVARSAQDVGTQKPGFERWKRELDDVGRSIDRWHTKLQTMRVPFTKQDIQDVEKYGQKVKESLRAIEEEQRKAYQEKMRRLREEEKQAGVMERDRIRNEIELTQRQQERLERETGSYREIAEETERSWQRGRAAIEERQAAERGAPARAGAGMMGAPLGFLRGAGMAIGAGLGIAGGMSLFGFLAGSLRLWMEVDTISTRLAHKLGEGPGSLKSTIGSVGAAFKYTDQQAAQFLETYSALARTTDDRRFWTLMGYSRVTGIEPTAAFQFGTVQRLTSMDEQQQGRFLNRFEQHLSMYGLQPMREQMIQTVSSIGQLFLERVERPSPTAMLFAMQAVARIGGGPEGPEVYRGPEAFRFVQGLQTALGPGGTDPGRAFRLRAYGYGRGTDYWGAIRREYEGLNRPENLIDVLAEMGRTFGGLPERQRNVMYMETWKKMGWGEITPDMVERLAKFTTAGGLENLRELRTTADVQKALKSELGIDFAAAGQSKASTAEEINRAIHGAQRFVGEKIGEVVSALKEGLEASAGRLADAFKAMATGDFSEAVKMFKAAVDQFAKTTTGDIGGTVERARREPEFGLEQVRRVVAGEPIGVLFPGISRSELGLRIHTMPKESLEEISAQPGGRRLLEQLAEDFPYSVFNVFTRTLFSPFFGERTPRFMRSTLQQFLAENPEESSGRGIQAIERNTAATERLSDAIERAQAGSPKPVVGQTE